MSAPWDGAETMLERVAIALSIADDPRPPEMSVSDHYRYMARTALQAMRHPTETMKGYAKHRCHISREHAHEVWLLMIDEALAK